MEMYTLKMVMISKKARADQACSFVQIRLQLLLSSVGWLTIPSRASPS